MKAFILAAGEGKRLKPLTNDIPKPLISVAGKPLLSYIMEALKESGITELTLLLGFKGERIREFYGNEFKGMKLTYVEQGERMGTAHAVSFAEQSMDEAFLCINGDILISSYDIDGMMKEFNEKRCTIMAATSVSDPRRFGVLEVDDGFLKKIHEKPENPPSHLINAGAFIFNTTVFDEIRKTQKSVRGEYEITDTLMQLAASEKVFVYELEDEWMDIGVPEDLIKAEKILEVRQEQ